MPEAEGPVHAARLPLGHSGHRSPPWRRSTTTRVALCVPSPSTSVSHRPVRGQTLAAGVLVRALADELGRVPDALRSGTALARDPARRLLFDGASFFELVDLAVRVRALVGVGDHARSLHQKQRPGSLGQGSRAVGTLELALDGAAVISGRGQSLPHLRSPKLACTVASGRVIAGSVTLGSTPRPLPAVWGSWSQLPRRGVYPAPLAHARVYSISTWL